MKAPYSWLGCWWLHGAVVTCRLHQHSRLHWAQLLLGWVTNRLLTGKSYRSVIIHLGQLSLPFLRERLMEYQPVWLRLWRSVFTCIEWQVTLCDQIWQETPRGSKTTCSGELYHLTVVTASCSNVHSVPLAHINQLPLLRLYSIDNHKSQSRKTAAL